MNMQISEEEKKRILSKYIDEVALGEKKIRRTIKKYLDGVMNS